MIPESISVYNNTTTCHSVNNLLDTKTKEQCTFSTQLLSPHFRAMSQLARNQSHVSFIARWREKTETHHLQQVHCAGKYLSKALFCIKVNKGFFLYCIGCSLPQKQSLVVQRSQHLSSTKHGTTCLDITVALWICSSASVQHYQINLSNSVLKQQQYN